MTKEVTINAKKSSILKWTKYCNDIEFSLGELKIPEHKSLPIGDQNFVNSFVDEKMISVEKSLYSLYHLGCKPRHMAPEMIGFLYKQYCQSILRYSMENLFISESKLNEL
ncbi:hypothetical protein BpHYR1_002428 [Brachionus plicatilis]|uniref:Uncharacterized protein n=1 Tax=Brachionus plicatilis TaxID=10195 RepID=A0A3M7QYH4_BRAPC|nr:hypothetical protein BpHYR1_002428 [Brachionus plicatilis]